MKIISNMKMFKKLMLVFIIISLLTFIVGAVTVSKCNNINSKLKNTYNIDLQGTNALKELKINVTELRADVLFLRDKNNRSSMDDTIEEINSLETKDNSILESYKSSIVAEESKNMYSELTVCLDKWRTSRGKFVDLVKQNDYVGAEEHYKDVSKYRKAVFSLLDSEINSSFKRAQNNYNESEKIFKSALYLSM